MQQIQSQEEWVLYRLDRFYKSSENMNRVKDIIDGKSELSLRLIDWFVTNYAKKYNVGYTTKTNNYVVVYLSYKSHLKAYSKRMFDPFCRWKRIKFQNIDTTVGQLNFFEWAITDQVLDYLEAHKDEVHADMDARLHETKNLNINGKKRHELSRSATNSLKYHETKVTVKFE
jgi:hypothetical protein